MGGTNRAKFVCSSSGAISELSLELSAAKEIYILPLDRKEEGREIFLLLLQLNCLQLKIIPCPRSIF